MMHIKQSPIKVIKGLKEWLLYNIEYGDPAGQTFWYEVLGEIDMLEDGVSSYKRDL